MVPLPDLAAPCHFVQKFKNSMSPSGPPPASGKRFPPYPPSRFNIFVGSSSRLLPLCLNSRSCLAPAHISADPFRGVATMTQSRNSRQHLRGCRPNPPQTWLCAPPSLRPRLLPQRLPDARLRPPASVLTEHRPTLPAQSFAAPSTDLPLRSCVATVQHRSSRSLVAVRPQTPPPPVPP